MLIFEVLVLNDDQIIHGYDKIQRPNSRQKSLTLLIRPFSLTQNVFLLIHENKMMCLTLWHGFFPTYIEYEL